MTVFIDIKILLRRISMENEEKEVQFYKYCPMCKYRDLHAVQEPCNTCLDNPVNINSRKPVKFEEAKDKKGK